jgi:cobalt-zinc-cadmium efflux system outer membrane protein
MKTVCSRAAAATLALAVGCVTSDPGLESEAIRAQIEQAPETRAAAPPRLPEPTEPPGVVVADGVSDDEAVRLALWNNAAFREALAQLGFSRADLAQAGMLPNPTLSLLFPLGPKQLEYSVALSLDALWLQPRRVSIARGDGARSAQALVQTGLDLVRDVRVASAELALADERVRNFEALLALRTEIREIAQRRLALADISELEFAAVRLDDLQAREDAARSRAAARQAQQRWQMLLGLGLREPEPVLVATGGEEACAGDYASLWQQTLFARPDLRAGELAIETAASRAGLAVAEIFTLTALLDANGSGSSGFETGPGLSAAIPLLSQNQGARLRADAELERAAAAYTALVQRAHLELVTALERAQEAERELRSVRDEIEPQVGALLDQVRRAYALGNVGYLAVLEASRQELGVRTRKSELLAELRRSCAELDRSVGRRVREQRLVRNAQATRSRA